MPKSLSFELRSLSRPPLMEACHAVKLRRGLGETIERDPRPSAVPLGGNGLSETAWWRSAVAAPYLDCYRSL